MARFAYFLCDYFGHVYSLCVSADAALCIDTNLLVVIVFDMQDHDREICKHGLRILLRNNLSNRRQRHNTFMHMYMYLIPMFEIKFQI